MTTIIVKSSSKAEAETLAPDFWDDSKAAETRLKEIKSIKTWTDDYEAVQRAVADTDVLYDFYREGEASEAEMQAEYDCHPGESGSPGIQADAFG